MDCMYFCTSSHAITHHQRRFEKCSCNVLDICHFCRQAILTPISFQSADCVPTQISLNRTSYSILYGSIGLLKPMTNADLCAFYSRSICKCQHKKSETCKWTRYPISAFTSRTFLLRFQVLWYIIQIKICYLNLNGI